MSYFFTIYDLSDASILPKDITMVHWKTHVTLYFNYQKPLHEEWYNFKEKYPNLHISQVVPVIPISEGLLCEYRWINGRETIFPYGTGPAHHVTH